MSSQIWWSPTDRDGLIADAVHSTQERGRKGTYFYNVMPKQIQPSRDDARRGIATSSLMKAIHKTPTFQLLTLKFHDVLMQKILHHRFLFPHRHSLQVVIKGGFAQRLMDLHDDDMASDMDIVIYVDPGLPMDVFRAVRDTLSTLVLQSMAQFKRTLDHMLFLNRPHPSAFLNPEEIQEFKRTLCEALADASSDEQYYVSPLDDDIVRNKVSRNSFIITDSAAQDESVVRIEVPHFEMCETIPLRKTPLVCSHNRSIRFVRDAASASGASASAAEDPVMHGAFDLFRLRFNVMHCGDTVTADMIDVCLLGHDDAEQRDFWTRTHETGRRPVIRMADDRLDYAFSIPSLSAMIDDLYKMLNVYDCPESKRTKRVARYERLLRYRSDAKAKN